MGVQNYFGFLVKVPPSGGSLEIGNPPYKLDFLRLLIGVPPSGGSLEIGNLDRI